MNLSFGSAVMISMKMFELSSIPTMEDAIASVLAKAPLMLRILITSKPDSPYHQSNLQGSASENQCDEKKLSSPHKIIHALFTESMV